MNYSLEDSIIGEFLFTTDCHLNHDVSHLWFEDKRLGEIYQRFIQDVEIVSPYQVADFFGEECAAELVVAACGLPILQQNISELKAAYMKRKVLAELNAAISGIDSGGNVGEWVDRIAMAHDDPSGIERTVDLSVIVSERYRRLEAIQNGESAIDDFIKTGFTVFDEKVGGFLRGDMSLIGGLASAGKTSFALGCALFQAHQGNRVLWFNQDSPEASLANRVFASTGASMEGMRQGNLSTSDWQAMASSYQVKSGGFIVDSTPNLSISKLTSIARRQNRIKKVDVIYVDYLQQIDGEGSEYERVSKTSASLKRLANELNCSVVALVQLNRSAAKEVNAKPRMSQLRSSGQIEQDAFLIVFPFRPEVNGYRANETDLIIAKNKDGMVATLNNAIEFDEKSCRFINIKPQGFAA